MMTKLMAAVVVATITLGAGAAYATQCPLLIMQLREARVADQAKAVEVKKLADEAEKLHNQGKHAESIAKADEAAKVAGIQLKKKSVR